MEMILAAFRSQRFVQKALLVWVVPWALWVTASIYNQRQELAVTRTILVEFKAAVLSR